ncbi:Mitochondrial distribution and morphology protein 31, mitochondrial precursor [Ascosphaera pollenicola]|nr:Mitochondrial distribution and morphology protein 31, mitochondrial precursor [Ascosphaera pollenicola]
MSQNIGRRLFANFFKSHGANSPFSSASSSSSSPSTNTAWEFFAFVRGHGAPRNVSRRYSSRSPLHSRAFIYETPHSNCNYYHHAHSHGHSHGQSGGSRQLTRRFASGGFFVLGNTTHYSSPAAAAAAAADPAATAASATVVSATHNILRRSRQWRDAQRASCLTGVQWRRKIHSKSSDLCDCNRKSAARKRSGDHQGKAIEAPKPRNASHKVRYLPGIVEAGADKKRAQFNFSHRLPHVSEHYIHTPTKEQLLAASTGFWSRLKVRFKWFSIRSARPFTFDEIAALFSWVLIGHALWVIFATTTFFSIVIFAINTVLAQETLARWIGNYLTKSSSLKVVFESAIVPKWGDGVITFKNVFVSRRPGLGSGEVSKGSSETAAAAAAARDHTDGAAAVASDVEDDGNYTQFDLSISQVNVTLSFTRWFNGKGLLRDVEVRGVRGVVDRTHVWWPEGDLDPADFRREHQPGDFELESFKLDDLLVTVYHPGGFRPFPVSIFSCELPQLRRQWLFYDFLSATTMSGSYDNSLFTIHPRQTYFQSPTLLVPKGDEKPSPWKKHNRIRIDGLNIDHLNTGVTGPFGWIREGTVDIVADMMFPADNDESLAKVMADLYDRLEATVTANRLRRTLQHTDAPEKSEPWSLSDLSDSLTAEDDKRFVVTDLRVQLNNIRAQVPFFQNDLSYINKALVRPIVAYMNSRRTFIPVQCRIVKRIGDFDGSWTLWDSGMMDDLSAETYEAFARDVMDDQARRRRFKKVGLWSLQLAAQAIFMGMAGTCI